jgi:hypothetical protein
MFHLSSQFGPLFQTSSGKSTSLIGSLESQDGLLPRSVRLLFEQLRAKVKLFHLRFGCAAGDANAAKAARSPVSRTPVPSSSFSISAQSCEIFNDEIHDLLDPLKMDLRVRHSSVEIWSFVLVY